MNPNIPVIKDLKNNENIDDAIKYVMNEIKTQFASNVERSSNSYIELSLNPDFNSPLQRYSCTVYVRELDQFSYNRERDEETGDIYTVYDGLDIQLSWPSFGGVNVELCKDVLKLYTSVNDTCMLLKMAYAHKLIRLSTTREEEIAVEIANKKIHNESALVNFLIPEIAGMRVSSKSRKRSIINGPHVDEGYYTITIKSKNYVCYVQETQVTFCRKS